tara:strand:+ start:1296 stop:2030 length:735 start_codon:yes stop_codon:yes gene_type:complete
MSDMGERLLWSKVRTRRIKNFPAKYTPVLLERIAELVDIHGQGGDTVLDPMAGVGGIHALRELTRLSGLWTQGIELEQEWADCHFATEQGSVLELPFPDMFFDWVIVSPPYGNRMADNHMPGPDDKSNRITYRHRLGRALTAGSAGGMQWGDGYREFHRSAWAEAVRVLKPGGHFVLNCKDHIRKGVVQPVTQFHVDTLSEDLGMRIIQSDRVPVSGNGFGQNGKARIPYENIVLLRKWKIVSR